MEKYSNWRDRGTGVHPFLSHSTRSSSIVVHALLVLARLLLFILKFPFLLVVVLWLALMSVLNALIPVALVRQAFAWYTSALGCRVLMFLLGFYWIDRKVVSLSNRFQRVTKVSSPSAGEMIVCNHVSYVDILYFQAQFAPAFAFPVVRSQATSSDPGPALVLVCSFWNALRHTINQGWNPRYNPAAGAPLVSVADAMSAARSAMRPVVLFAEGCTSNGRLVLVTPPVFRKAPPPQRETKAHFYALKYPFTMFSPAYIVGNPFWHVVFLAGQLWNTLEVKVLTADEERTVADLAEDAEAVSTTLGNMLHVRRGGLGVAEKATFVAYWYAQHTGKRQKKE